ncbi:MAG TPA: hypothetical protein VFK20_15815, partial [Vicinamibacterales bacterium]|nr:hypothetical protein [Vicinamibacterales bacterium]
QPPHTIPADGGTPAAVPVSGQVAGRLFPSFLPDGRHYIYLAVGQARRGDAASLRLGTIDSAESTPLVASAGSGIYVDPGYLMFRRERSLVVQPFDPVRGELTGAPAALVDPVGYNALTYQTLVSASTAGVLAYAATMPAAQLAWFDSEGRQLGPAASPARYNSLCLSSDGSRFVYDAADTGSDNLDLWSAPVGGGAPERLTFDASVDFYGVCSDAANEVAFATLRHGAPSIYRVRTNAPGTEMPFVRLPAPLLPTDWSQHGRMVVFSRFDGQTRWDVWVQAAGAGKASPFAATAAEERNGRLSPDGHWMSYTSDETGSFEVYVQPFPATGAKWQISRGGGQQAVWRPDGRELFYVSRDRQIVGVDVATSDTTFRTGTPRVVIGARVGGWERTNQGSPYAITPDGKRILVILDANAARPVGLILNWPGLQK